MLHWGFSKTEIATEFKKHSYGFQKHTHVIPYPSVNTPTISLIMLSKFPKPALSSHDVFRSVSHRLMVGHRKLEARFLVSQPSTTVDLCNFQLPNNFSNK